MSHLIYHKRIGQSIVETLLAVSVAVIIIGALVNLAVIAVKESRSARDRIKAEKMAVEGIEAVRSIRDAGWTPIGVATSGPHYALSWSGDSWSISQNNDCEVTGIFKRCVDFANFGTGKRVVVNVFFGAPKPITLQTVLTDWQ